MKNACIIQLQIAILYATPSSHVFEGSLKLRILACLMCSAELIQEEGHCFGR
jgi:hypothetical protein